MAGVYELHDLLDLWTPLQVGGLMGQSYIPRHLVLSVSDPQSNIHWAVVDASTQSPQVFSSVTVSQSQSSWKGISSTSYQIQLTGDSSIEEINWVANFLGGGTVTVTYPWSEGAAFVFDFPASAPLIQSFPYQYHPLIQSVQSTDWVTAAGQLAQQYLTGAMGITTPFSLAASYRLVAPNGDEMMVYQLADGNYHFTYFYDHYSNKVLPKEGELAIAGTQSATDGTGRVWQLTIGEGGDATATVGGAAATVACTDSSPDLSISSTNDPLYALTSYFLTSYRGCTPDGTPGGGGRHGGGTPGSSSSGVIGFLEKWWIWLLIGVALLLLLLMITL